MSYPGLRWCYFFEADPQTFGIKPSYVKAKGKSLSSSLPSPKLHICYICVTFMYLLYISMINVAFILHLCDMIAHTCDIYVT